MHHDRNSFWVGRLSVDLQIWERIFPGFIFTFVLILRFGN
ncbi:hypothetical protein LEP1GSC061_3984 [Leptospira wolffii serovar Khorat str. Khorat-H2]|nr:hypothetical protein LEP1GSC061_3984 [Leptospira wolffii serovar Khorat str. Khorat-H2]